MDFQLCFERRMQMQADGLELNFLSMDDFKTNKKATGRHKDLADLELLESPRRDGIG